MTMILAPTLHLGQASTAGPRAKNEDFHGAIVPEGLLCRRGSLVCMADGIGGCSDPRRASESTVRSLLNDYYATPESWTSVMALVRVTASINAWMFRQGQKLDRGLGTTLVAALFKERRLILLWVGDSRMYRLRKGRLERLTRDHLFPNPEVSLLTKAVGMDDAISPEIREVSLQEGDRFLLITDGVWNVMADRDLARLAMATPDCQDLAGRLIQEAESRKTWDNATAMVVDVVALPMEGVADIRHVWRDLPLIIPPKVGEERDGFYITRKMHAGHQGILLEAVDTHSEDNVLLKFPDPMAGEDPMVMERFAREEWTGLRVSHPNIVAFRPQPLGRRSAVYCVLESLTGQTLQTLVEGAKQGLSGDLVADWMRQVARGLMVLHRKGIIHRDVKPDNVMLTKNGTVVLLDLGNVRVYGLEPLAEEAVGTRIVGGTPGFMAPELYAGARGDERTDLFALGVTGYLLLTGRPPFGQPESNIMPDFALPPALLELRPDTSPGLAALVEKCLALDPDERFGDMGEFLFFMDNPSRVKGRRPIPLVARNPQRFYQTGFWLFFVMTILLSLLVLSKK